MIKFAFSKPSGDEADTEILFSHFGSLGYNGLQLKAGQYMPFIDNPQGFIDKYGQYPGAASALICWCPLDDQGRQLLKNICSFGAAVGSEMIVFCHNAPREGVTHDMLRAYAKELSEIGTAARDAGLVFSLHNHYDQPVMYRDDIEIFFDAADAEAVGLTIDTAHLVKSGEHDIAGIIRQFHQVINNYHLKDIRDGAFKVLGTASIDFDPVFSAIRDTGYSGWVSTDEESGADMREAMQHCIQFMKAGLIDG
jgi:sugar phosphate isomerase/epimerase